MRIAFVVNTAEPYYRGGYETRAWQIARKLAARHEVDLYTSAPARVTLDGVRIYPVVTNRPYFDGHGFRRLEADALYTAGLTRLLATRRRERYDIVDCNATPYAHIPTAALLAKTWGARLVVTAHEALAAEMEGYFRARRTPSPRLAGALGRVLYRWGNNLADHITATSEMAASGLEAEGARRVSVSHGAIEQVFDPRPSYEGRLVAVGRLVPNKRMETVVRAAARLISEGFASELHVVGTGSERASLEALARSLGLDAVKFHGEVDEVTKWKILISETDVYMSGSLREGLSIATLEAMAAGNVPVISHQPAWVMNGAIEYVAHRETGLISDGEVDSLVASVRELALNPSLYQQLSLAAVTTATRYTWDTAADELEEIYFDVIRKRV